MRGILLVSLLVILSCALPPQVGASGTRPLSLSIDIGNITERPIAPEFAFERFFQTRPLGQFQFAPDNRFVYFIRNDGQVDNIFTMDLASVSLAKCYSNRCGNLIETSAVSFPTEIIQHGIQFWSASSHFRWRVTVK
jgi:hypothetical protein